MSGIDLHGRLCMVAGAGGGGIGTATCAVLAGAGATILAVDNSEAGCALAAQTLAPFGNAHRVAQVDLTDPVAVEAAIAEAERVAGPLHGLVNIVGGVAGHDLFAPMIAEDALALFERLMRFNTVPMLTASRAAARAMIAHGVGGSIVNLASAAGFVSMPYAAGYAAAKAALINLTRTMAVEWGTAQIRVNAVSPGSIATKKIGRAQFTSDDQPKSGDGAAETVVPLGRRGRPEDVAGPILFLLSDLAVYVTGQTIGVDGGMLARPPYNDADGLPVFLTDPALRERLADR